MTATKQGTTIKMPKLGESVTEGTIAGWLKKVGDRVERYDPMVEVITDKVNAEVPAPVSGTLVEILSEEGDVVPVGEIICVIDTGEISTEVAGDEPEDRTVLMSAAPLSQVRPSKEMLYSAGPTQKRAEKLSTNGSSAHDVAAEISSARKARDEQALLNVRSSPLVRRLAEEHEIDLATVEGTGIGGRVTKSDIEAHIKESQQPKASPPIRDSAPARPPARVPQINVWPGDEVTEASPMRRQIAEHMVRSVTTAPHVTVWMEVDMSAVVDYREAHKADFQAREGFSLTYVPLVLSVVVRGAAGVSRDQCGLGRWTDNSTQGDQRRNRYRSRRWTHRAGRQECR